MTAVRWRRILLLGASLACAACGLVYELGLLNLATSLTGSSLRSSSIVLGTFVFAMGIGSIVSKALVERPLAGFVGIELALATIGGTSGLLLYLGYARYDLYEPGVLAFALVIGALIGAEIPLLMELLQGLRETAASRDTADLMAADYLGALVGGLAFPVPAGPRFGLVQSSLAAGVLNVACALLVVLAASPGRTLWRAAAPFTAVLVLLGVVWARTDGWLVDARQRLYDDPIVSATRSPYQDVVLTRSGNGKDLRLFLNGDLQFSSVDEYRFHEALVHPAMGRPTPVRRVLVLGGGDGLAVRELLRYPEVEEITLVDLDPAVTDLARTDPRVVALNEDALADPRVDVVHADAMRWVDDRAREGDERFDVVIVDFPDPDDLAVARLYSVEMYLGIRAVLAPDGAISVQSGSPWFAPDAFWCVERTLAEAGFATVPYHVDVPSFGDWGFVAAQPAADGPPDLAVDPSVTTRFLTDAELTAAKVFAADRDRRDVRPSTLDDPVIADYTARGWNDY